MIFTSRESWELVVPPTLGISARSDTAVEGRVGARSSAEGIVWREMDAMDLMGTDSL